MLHLAIIVLLVCFFLYVQNLEEQKCDCSDNWKRDYIKYFTGFMVLSSSVSLFYPGLQRKVFGGLNTIVGILGIAYIFIIISWIHKLYKDKCDCSDSWERMAMMTYAYIVLALYIIMFIIAISLMMQISSSKVKMSKKQIQHLRKILRKND